MSVAAAAVGLNRPSCASPFYQPYYNSSFALAVFTFDSRFEYPSDYPGDQHVWVVNLCNQTDHDPKAAEPCGAATPSGRSTRYWAGEWDSGKGKVNASCLSYYPFLDVAASSSQDEFGTAMLGNPVKAPGNLSMVFRSENRSSSLHLVFICDPAATRGLLYLPAEGDGPSRSMTVRTATLCPQPPERPCPNPPCGGGGDEPRQSPLLLLLGVASCLLIVAVAAIFVAVRSYRRFTTTRDAALIIASRAHPPAAANELHSDAEEESRSGEAVRLRDAMTLNHGRPMEDEPSGRAAYSVGIAPDRSLVSRPREKGH